MSVKASMRADGTLGTMTVRSSVGVDTEALARMVRPVATSRPAPVGGPISVRVCVPTPNPSNGSRGHWAKAARLGKQQREAVALVLAGQVPPPGPWTVTLTRSSTGKLDPDGLQTALKRVRDVVAQHLLGGRVGERDDDAAITWRYNQRSGKRGHPCVDVDIITRKDS